LFWILKIDGFRRRRQSARRRRFYLIDNRRIPARKAMLVSLSPIFSVIRYTKQGISFGKWIGLIRCNNDKSRIYRRTNKRVAFWTV
jgi:hypothetical protein